MMSLSCRPSSCFRICRFRLMHFCGGGGGGGGDSREFPGVEGGGLQQLPPSHHPVRRASHGTPALG